MNLVAELDAIAAELAAGKVVPYFGPDTLALCADCPVSARAEDLAAKLTGRVSVPFKIRTNLTAAAQYIENFKHRKTLAGLMNEAFSTAVAPSPLHRHFAGLKLPLMVETWYDGTLARAMPEGGNWGMVQGVSRAEHRDQWVKYYRPDGAEAAEADADNWETLVYQPIGAFRPAGNYIVSDSDYVEVLTEIDIQTPIPPRVRELRAGRRFLFLGCRFSSQLTRSYARQVMKRSSAGPHWAVLPGDITANEARFLEEQNILRLDMDLHAFLDAMTDVVSAP